jgi:TetR/AcrR family transcriptional regulator, transcriptional repressor for nem operon
MRYDPEHKQRTHEKVLHEAAEAIRLQGPDRISIAELMTNAGLTHGGFYAHFKSKDELIAEAVDWMFAERRAAFAKNLETKAPADALGTYIDLYLSPRHRDHREQGCPVAALGSDLVRLPNLARERFDAGIQRFTINLANLLQECGHKNPDTLARSVFCEMIGALILSRNLLERELSGQILVTARTNLRNRLGLPD